MFKKKKRREGGQHLKKKKKKKKKEKGSVPQNVLKFYQQLTGEERRIPFIFDDFHFCRSRVIGLDMMENRMFTLCRHRYLWTGPYVAPFFFFERQK
jgi:hypothetical protein